MAFVEALKPLHVVPCGAKERAGTVEILRRFEARNLTLADAMGLFVMGERAVRSCWSTDFHLGLTGVPLVIHAT